LQRGTRHTAGVAQRYARFADPHERHETRADDNARERRRPSFFHIKEIGTAQIAQPDSDGSLRPAA
jgi:hypothetical protein